MLFDLPVTGWLSTYSIYWLIFCCSSVFPSLTTRQALSWLYWASFDLCSYLPFLFLSDLLSYHFSVRSFKKSLHVWTFLLAQVSLLWEPLLIFRSQLSFYSICCNLHFCDLMTFGLVQFGGFERSTGQAKCPDKSIVCRKIDMICQSKICMIVSRTYLCYAEC